MAVSAMRMRSLTSTWNCLGVPEPPSQQEHVQKSAYEHFLKLFKSHRSRLGFQELYSYCQDRKNLCLVQNSTTSWKVPAQLQVPKSLHFPVQPLLLYKDAFSILRA